LKKMSTALQTLVLVLTLSLSGSGFTREKEPFSPERFKALQAEGALVVLDVFAEWCPTCAKQQEVLAAYRQAHPDVKLHVLEIDFDNDKKAVSEFRAPRPRGHSAASGCDRARPASRARPALGARRPPATAGGRVMDCAVRDVTCHGPGTWRPRA
jgi:thioredoxin 1